MIYMISVLIVDDHPIVLEGSKNLFQGMDDLLIETESNPKNVITKMKQTHFDVFLIDVNMAIQNGIVLAAEIKANQEGALVILYTGDDIRSYYSLILEKKVDGVLSKTASRNNVIQTIRSLTQGHLVIPVDFVDYVTRKMQNQSNNLKLTNKEKQLIDMLQKGYTNKMMAEQLRVSQRTIERYLTQLFTLLEVPSREKALEFIREKIKLV